jgi:hypothetical protein
MALNLEKFARRRRYRERQAEPSGFVAKYSLEMRIVFLH